MTPNFQDVAHTDELTGYYNRMGLREALQKSLDKHIQQGGQGVFLIADVDRLAVINSAHGHDAGDALLIAVGRRLAALLSGEDALGRLAGDRYGLVIHTNPEQNIYRLAEKILNLFRQGPVQTSAGDFHITVSIGCIDYPHHDLSAQEALRQAEDCVILSKETGRNRATVYRASTDQKKEHQHQIQILEEVKSAVSTGRLVFAYQPIVNAHTEKTDFYECLLRLIRTDGSIMAASLFIPLVEKLGLSGLIDHYVLERAIVDLQENSKIVLAINVSGFTVLDRSWMEALTGFVKNRPDMAKRLIIEITETASVPDLDEMVHFIRSAQALSVRVALDDFGAGYTTFKHLRALPVDIVKIDGAYIRNLQSQKTNRLFVKNLVDLIKSMGLSTLAECVETREDADILKKEGVQFLQGYYFGKPSLNKPWGSGR